MSDATDRWPPEVEGVIHAHRRILEAILVLLASNRADGRRILDEIEARLGFTDDQEDPGADPDVAFAVESVADAEVQRLLAAVREGVAALRPAGGPEGEAGTPG